MDSLLIQRMLTRLHASCKFGTIKHQQFGTLRDFEEVYKRYLSDLDSNDNVIPPQISQIGQEAVRFPKKESKKGNIAKSLHSNRTRLLLDC